MLNGIKAEQNFLFINRSIINLNVHFVFKFFSIWYLKDFYFNLISQFNFIIQFSMLKHIYQISISLACVEINVKFLY